MTRRGILLFALMSVIWGIPYLFIRVAVEEITPATLVFARTSVAALILLPIAVARVDLRAVLARWRWVVAFAAVEIAVPWVMLGSAEQHVSSSLAGLLIAGVPLVGTALALATGGTDRASRAGIIGLLIGLVGVLAIVGSDFEASDATPIAQIGVVIVGYAIGPAILSRRLPCARYTYGLRRSSVLAALFNAVLLLVVTGGIAWEAARRFAEPTPVGSVTIIWVAAAGILVNTATALLFLAGRTGDLNIRGAFFHMAGDALVAAGVVATGLLILKTGWLWLDPVVSLVISVVLVAGTWHLLRDSLNLSLDGVPAGIDSTAVRRFLATLPGVREAHDLHIWGMSTTETALTVHLVMPAGFPGDAFLADARHELDEHFGIAHATIQIETGDPNSPCALAPDQVV